MTGSQSRTSENGTSRVVAGRPPRVYSGSYWSTLVGSSTLSAPPSTPRAPPPKRRQRVAAACCWCERNLVAAGPLTSPESWPLGAKTARESSGILDPPKGCFQYNPRSRRDTAPWPMPCPKLASFDWIGKIKYFEIGVCKTSVYQAIDRLF